MTQPVSVIANPAVGQLIGSQGDDGVLRFAGVRYGSAQRFQRPTGLTPHTRAVDARVRGPIPPQTPSSAKAMNDALGGKGNVVVIAGQAGNGTTEGRTSRFTDELKRLGSGIKVLATVNADFDQQKALVASRDLITRYGDQIDGVYANDDTMARGFIQANQENGNKLKPAIVGINGQTEPFASIKSGEMAATILQSPYRVRRARHGDNHQGHRW